MGLRHGEPRFAWGVRLAWLDSRVHSLTVAHRSVGATEDAGYIERGKLKSACEKFRIAYDTAAQAVRVCKAFESCRRLQQLTFEHHQSVANHPAAARPCEKGLLLESAASGHPASIRQRHTLLPRIVTASVLPCILG